MYENNFQSRAIFRRGPFLVNLGQLIMLGKVSPSRACKTDEEQSYRTNTKNEKLRLKVLTLQGQLLEKRDNRKATRLFYFWDALIIFSPTVQSAKILLLPPKYEIIMVPSNYSFFSIAPCKVITLNPLCILFFVSVLFFFF